MLLLLLNRHVSLLHLAEAGGSDLPPFALPRRVLQGCDMSVCGHLVFSTWCRWANTILLRRPATPGFRVLPTFPFQVHPPMVALL